MGFIENLIEPIEGDIVILGSFKYLTQSDPRLIFDERKRLEVIEQVHVIINNAATIDFDTRLDQALQINFHGPLRILALAKLCKRLEVFTHVSTAYVNSEKQYDFI